MRYLTLLVIGAFASVVVLSGCAGKIMSRNADGAGQIELRDSVLVAYESLGDGDVAVVFLHCWTCNRSYWRHQVEAIAEAGYRVVTLDLPGHGQSPAHREEWTLQGLAADVDEVITALGLARVVLIGHGMGGRLALLAASDSPERVIGVGCVDSLRNAEFIWPEGSIERLAQAVGSHFHQTIEQFVSAALHPRSRAHLEEWIVVQASATDQAVAVAILRSFSGSEISDEFSGAGVPIRCINSSYRDRHTSRTEIEINRNYSDFDAILMEEVGHYPQLEKPEEFNAHLLHLLTELTGRNR